MASSAEALAVPETAQLAVMGGTRSPTPPTPVPPQPPPTAPPPPVAASSSSENTAPVPVPEDTGDEGEEVVVQRKGPSLGLILGGVGLLLFLVVAIAGVLVYRRFVATPAPSPVPSPVAEATPTPPPLPSPSVEPAITTGSLHVESQPIGATVKIDGEPRGVTPLDVPELPLGPHQVLVELRGYAPQTQAVDLTAEQPRSDLTITLSRTAPTQGVAEISSSPSGALVEIDGTPAGQTPLVEHRLRAGPHRVHITKEGFEPWSGTVAVTAGKKARLDAQLKAIPRATPTPTPEVADPNRVYFEHELDTAPKKVSGRSAEYPSGAPALRRGQRASVTVSFVVTENGDVTDVQVMESGGSQLDESVMSAFRTWKFTPGVKNGQKVKVKLSRRHTFLGG